MKKIFKFIAPLVLLLASCGVSNLKKDTTVILDVTSDVTPTFSANYGEGSYTGNVYTHHVSLRKDLYIYLNYEGLATETVFVSADEMNVDTIRKSVTFGQALSSIITITADNIDDMSKVAIESSKTIKETKFDDKKKKQIKLYYDGRDEDIDLTLKLEGYKDTFVHVDKEKLKGGLYSIKHSFLKTNETVLTVSNLYGQIYEYPTYAKVKDFYSWDNQMTNYILDTDHTYFASYWDGNITRNKLIDKDKGLVIEGKQDSNRYDYLGVLRFRILQGEGEGKQIYNELQIVVIDFVKKQLKSDRSIYQEYLDSPNYGVTFTYWTPEGNKRYIIRDLSKLPFKKEKMDEYSTNYYYTYDLDNFDGIEECTFIKKRYDILNPDTLINEEISYDSWINGTLDFEIVDNKLIYKSYEFDYMKYLKFNIVDEKGNLLKAYDSQLFNLRFNTEVEVKGQLKSFNIDIIEDFLKYDEATNSYSYPDYVIDTTKSPVKVYSISQSQYLWFDVAFDETADVFVSVENDSYSSFEGIEGHTYVLYRGDGSNKITLTADDIELGVHIIGTLTEYIVKTIPGFECNYSYNAGAYQVGYSKLDEDNNLHIFTVPNGSIGITHEFTCDEYRLDQSTTYIEISTLPSSNEILFVPFLSKGVFNSGYNQDLFWNNFESPMIHIEEQNYWNYVAITRTGKDVAVDYQLNSIPSISGNNWLNIFRNNYSYNEQYKLETLNPDQYRILHGEYYVLETLMNDNIFDLNNTYRQTEHDTNFLIVPKDTVLTVKGTQYNLGNYDSLYLDLDATWEWDYDLQRNVVQSITVTELDTMVKIAQAN